MKKMNAHWTKTVTAILVFVMFLTLGTNVLSAEAAQTRASDCIQYASATITAQGSGKLKIALSVTGTAAMGEIGVSGMVLYESTDQTNWTIAGTYNYHTHSNLIAYNTISFSSSVTHNGVAGRYYKAYVCFWAGNGGAGDSYYTWTSVVKAT